MWLVGEGNNADRENAICTRLNILQLHDTGNGARDRSPLRDVKLNRVRPPTPPPLEPQVSWLCAHVCMCVYVCMRVCTFVCACVFAFLHRSVGGMCAREVPEAHMLSACMQRV